MSRAPIEDLLHRVNNLLGTFEVQAEVARATNTEAALRAALAVITESAARTNAEVQRFRKTLLDGGAT